MSRLVLDRLAKRFGDHAVLEGVSLEVPEREVLALLGPSGSGKTTLLRLVAGFETHDAGTIRLGDERIDRLPPERRGFGMVFQHYALFPHLTVGENVAFGLEARRRPRGEIRERVAAALARVDLAGFAARKVGELSGGQQQRVALARALAPEPRVLLLDEPLSNLDPSLRERTRRELRSTLAAVGITTLLVTHEQEEAFELGDRVALLSGGRLEQVATPRELYGAPATRFAAGFVGRASFVPVEVEAAVGAGARAELMLRPEHLRLAAPDEPGALAGEVVAVRFAGATSFVAVAAEGAELEVAVDGEPPAPGARVGVALRAGARPRLFAASERA